MQCGKEWLNVFEGQLRRSWEFLEEVEDENAGCGGGMKR